MILYMVGRGKAGAHGCIFVHFPNSKFLEQKSPFISAFVNNGDTLGLFLNKGTSP